MNDPILSREAIAADADLAAQRYVLHGMEQPNPHVEGTEAALLWRNAYARLKAFYLDPEAGASA